MALDESNLSPQERKIYRQATQLLERGVDAPAFSARFFGTDGELAQLGAHRLEGPAGGEATGRR